MILLRLIKPNFSSVNSTYIFRIISILLTFQLLCIACVQTKEPSKDLSIVWEGWEQVKNSYVEFESLNLDEINGSIITSMLKATGKPSYPFLKELNEIKRVPPRKVPQELSDVWKAWKLFEQKWPNVDLNIISDAALEGMVKSLGVPSAQHFTPEAYKRTKEALKGSFEGIGAYLGRSDDTVFIVSVIKNGPAERAGIKVGDIIQQVNGTSLEGYTVDEAIEIVRGPEGTKVILKVARSGENTKEFEIIRGNINLPTVDVQLFPGAIGYIVVAQFSDTTGDAFVGALENLRKAEALALIVDLRNNPGGSVKAARTVASQFLDDGLLMYEIDKDGKRTDVIVEEGGIATENFEGFPLVVLINEFTASTAEVVSGALQDNDRAQLMGVTTIGKGSNHVFHELTNGAAMYLPVSEWFTPSGQVIQGKGIQPDIVALLSREDITERIDSQLSRAYEYLNSILPPFR